MHSVSSQRLSSAIILILLLAGCDSLYGTSFEIKIETDRSSYIARSDTVRLMATNLSSDPVYFLCSGTIVLQELTGKEVNNSWLVQGFEFCGVPRAIEPEATLISEFHLAGLETCLAEAVFSESVRYRFDFHLYSDKRLKQTLENDSRLSNQFTIVN